MRKKVQRVVLGKIYSKWRDRFLKNSSLRFLELNLDMARVRLSVTAIKNYAMFLEKNRKNIENARKNHLLNQWFQQLKKLVRKKKILARLQE